MRTDTPPPHATHQCGLFEASFARASSTLALVQIRNGLKALAGDAPCPVSPRMIVQNIEANLQILERNMGAGQ